MADYIHDIRTLLPQGPPFIMVDRLIGTNGPVTRTSYLVSAGGLLVDNGRFSAAGLIENMAQTAAAGLGFEALTTGAGPGSGAIVAINHLEIHDLPAVGDELLTETTVTVRVGDIIVISGKVTCRQSTVAVGEMKILAGI